MNRLHFKYLLIGAGLASHAAAAEIRLRDAQGSVLMVGQEINRPYHRPPLSKSYLRGQSNRETLFAADPAWYASQGITLRTGHRAAHLDTARRMVSLDSGDEISFDQLLIATGASPRHLMIPGADLPGVYYLRSLEDADRLRHAIDQARAHGRPHSNLPAGSNLRGRGVVIGAGLLGVELAAAMKQLGIEIHLAVAGSQAWEKFAGDAAGRFITAYLQQRGVHVHLGGPPLRFEGDGRVQRVVLSQGISGTSDSDTVQSIDCDFVAVAIGAVTHKELLRGTPIIAEQAVIVDDHCRTSVPDIYAAGDCAAIFDPLFGKHCIAGQWDSAISTGTLAAQNMTGGNAAYRGISSFSSEVFDLSLRAWGHARFATRRLVRGTTHVESPTFVEFGIAPDGRVAQVLSIGHANAGDSEIDAPLEQFVRGRFQVAGHEEEMKNPSIPLATLLQSGSRSI